MDEEKYRFFLAIAAVATTLTFLFQYGPSASDVASVWSAAVRHPWLAIGLAVPLAAGLAWGAGRWLDER